MRKVIVILIVLSVLLCGCDAGYNRSSAGASGFDQAICVIQNAVPYTGGIDLRLDSISLLETDEYGRSLFFYRMTLSQIGILLIVHDITEQTASYYEDRCYMLCRGADLSEDFSRADRLLLKEWNDWNQPLRADKLRTVACTTPADHENVQDYLHTVDTVQGALQNWFPEEDWSSARVTMNGLETYAEQGQVVLVEVYIEKGQAEYYLVLYDPRQSPAVRCAESAGSMDDFRERIIEFKENYCK